MSDHFNVIVVAWMFLGLIGAWLLVNALIDLGARRLRHWISERWRDEAAVPQHVSSQSRPPQ